MCADAKTALAIAVVPYAIEEKMEESLYQVRLIINYLTTMKNEVIMIK